MTFAETIAAGVNNPECAYFVGAVTGQFLTFRLLIALLAGYFVFKAVDKLAFEPALDWAKNKWRKART